MLPLEEKAYGINYVEASKSILRVNIQDTSIPFASPELLLRLKNTVREKDKIDRLFLEQLLQHDWAGIKSLSRFYKTRFHRFNEMNRTWNKQVKAVFFLAMIVRGFIFGQILDHREVIFQPE